MKGADYMKNAKDRILLSTKELEETEEYVLTRFCELTEDGISVSYEKGIKNDEGDIVVFVRI